MVPAYSSKGNEYMMQLVKMVKENKVGGIIAMQGGPMRHISMVNQLQLHQIPLWLNNWGHQQRFFDL